MRTRLLAVTLASFMAAGMTPALAAQSGVIAGTASDEAKKPYTNYDVQLRDITTGQVVGTSQINDKGQFTFDSVQMSQKMLVELVNLKDKKIVCTEGPYVLSTSMASKTDVNIECGKTPTSLWLLAAGAGTAAAIAVGAASGSR
jgi:hypothetical protein